MCKVMANTKDMPREEWLRLRRQGIGGSDAGAVCGLNPYQSAMEVYHDKTGAYIEDEETLSESARSGRDLEDYVARRFMEETGLKVRRSNKMYRHDTYPFMIADVDRLIVGENAGLECKTASPYTAEKWKDGKIPAHYLAQCYHYMAVLDADAWYIAVLIYGKEFKWLRLERDEEIIGSLIQMEQDFWENHVAKRVLPKPDGSKAAEEFINGHFADSIQDLSVPLTGFDDKLRRREELTGIIDRLTAEKRQIEQEIKVVMDEAEFGEAGDFLVTWKNSVSNRLDTRKLKAEMPEVYEKFCTPVSSRRFLVKVA